MRKLAFGSLIVVLVIFGRGNMSGGEPVLTPRGELRIVDKSPTNWISLTFQVFEHLLEIDAQGNLVPRLATAWRWLNDRTLEFTLRQGVTFHNGEMLDAEIVKLNWDEQSRLHQPHTAGAMMNFTSGSRMEIIDPQTVRFIFPEPDGGALAKLTIMHIANRQFYQEVGWGTEHW
jgi:ABC-type transport system substrate-binding protein